MLIFSIQAKTRYTNLTFVKVVFEEKVSVTVIHHDAPEIAEDLIKDLKVHGVTVVYRHLNYTPDLARKVEKAGVDIIFVTGMDERGILPVHNMVTFSIVPFIADSVKIPVMVAGGITDRRTFKIAFAFGAEGAFCRTLFLLKCKGNDAESKCYRY